MKRAAIIFLFWFIGASCIQEFSVENKRCPCAEGWKCCLPETGENVCVIEGGSCPCAGVTCESPPENHCVDENTLRTYAKPGECVLGECQYNHNDETCPEGCEGTTCKNTNWEWKPISTDNAPTASHYSSAVWMPEYQKMLVVGGMEARTWASTYDPEADRWESIENCNVGGYNPGLVWTGEVALIWGERGLYYDPSTGFCGNLPAPPVTLGTIGPSAVWTGFEMIVWGGRHSIDTTVGARYLPGSPDPGQGDWTPTSTGTGCPSARGDQATVWTGDRMIVWGGTTPPGADPINSGAMYDPEGDTWSPTSTGSNCPSPRAFASTAAVWTGEEMIVWGGGAGPGAITPLRDGGAYDPVSDRWRKISESGAPAERSLHTAVWAGQEMIVWGGSFNGGIDVLSDGGHYNPSTDSWTPIVSENAPSGRYGHIAVWTGKEMIIWGGADENGALGDGAVYSYVPDVYGKLIATRSSGTGMWSSESTDQVAIYLAYGWFLEECRGEIGMDTPHSGPGTTVYNADNEAGFDDLVACMTNGTDDYLREGTMFYPNGNGSEGNFNESEFWNKGPDLAGCTITRILHVISSLTITPDGAGGANVDGEWVWEVWGNCGGVDPDECDLDVIPAAVVEFINVPPGETADPQDVTVRNIGYSDLAITSIWMDPNTNPGNPPVFGLKDVPALPFVLAPGQARTFQVTFTDNTMIEDELGQLEIYHDCSDESNPYILFVQSTGTPANLPPVAIIDPPAATVHGLDQICLDGTQSFDPDPGDSVDRYLWSFLFKPTDPQGNESQATLDSTDQPTTCFTPDVYGVYIVRLIVFDTFGTASRPMDTEISVNP